MARITLLSLAFILGSGCAVSEIQRVNKRLKLRNDKLLKETRHLEARVSAVQEELSRKEQELRRTKGELSRLRNRFQDRTGPSEASASPQVDAKEEFKGVEGVEVVQDRGAGTTRVILEEKVFFKPGSCAINQKGRKILSQVASILKNKYSGRTIRVDGHTDNTPIRQTKDEYPSNWELSTDRACAVVRELLSAGVPPENVFASGFAFYRPVASNKSEAGRRKNRRVEIVIMNE